MSTGAYKAPLLKGLRAMGKDDLARKVEEGTIKIGIKELSGDVPFMEELREILIRALELAKGVECTDTTIQHYIDGLQFGTFVPLDPQDAWNVSTQGPVPDKQYGPGELFFTS